MIVCKEYYFVIVYVILIASKTSLRIEPLQYNTLTPHW